jgi:hypothetical protein
MSAPRDRRHLLVRRTPEAPSFKPPPRKIEIPAVPAPPSRPAHGLRLQTALEHAIRRGAALRTAAPTPAVPSITVEFESRPDVDLNVPSLEARRSGIEVLSVREQVGDDGRKRQLASVRIPEGKVSHFIKQFERYSRETPKAKGEHRHEDLYDRVGAIHLATLRSFWTDPPDAYPIPGQSIWWEIWLRHAADDAAYLRFVAFARERQIPPLSRRLVFDDRVVVLAFATAEALAASNALLSDLAELRRAHEVTGFFEGLSTADQADWIRAMLPALTPAPPNAPAVCVLDTGVNRGHPLLSPVIWASDVHTADPGWLASDHDGHGTSMAGLAAYGDLAPALASHTPISIGHAVESVKILPPPGRPGNPPELYGAVTALGAATVEAASPTRRRIYSMAVTAPQQTGKGLGAPTLWSASVDALAAGRSFDPHTDGLTYLDDRRDPQRRLIVVSAGNVGDYYPAHLDRSDATEVEDPAQAWNALVVGAHTERSTVAAPEWAGWRGISPPGELSPYSTTSVQFKEAWPIRPDVVFEGGNVGVDGRGATEVGIPDLNLLSLHHRPTQRLLALTSGTSAACAQVARLCALLSSDYPDLWPETLRALVVHSARWTVPMGQRMDAGGKVARLALLRRYGYGVPDEARMRRSARDALTLIVQGQIRPFAEGKMREMHLHSLPWPKAALEALGEAKTRLRVTLSYFVEPNPARRGWQARYKYASHALRFDVMRASETPKIFMKRVNQAAVEEDERRPRAVADDWYLGPQARNRGSMHSDVLEGTAAALASRGVIAVFPVGGWWKDTPKRDRSSLGARYALVVSVETPEVESDIWTPVAQEIGVVIS